MSEGAVRLPLVAPGRGALRLTRSAIFAIAAVGLASAAHLAGGETVSPIDALISVPAVMIVINLLAGARRGYASLFPAMLVTQVLLHVGFMAGSIARSCHLAGVQAMSGMPPVGQADPVVRCGSSMAHHGFWPSPFMLLAHALAAALLVIVLAHGEAAVWALAASLGFRRVPAGPGLRLPVVPRVPVAVRTALQPRSSVPRRSVRRRGPPVLARAAP